MRPPPSADPHGCVQNGRLPAFVTKPRNSLCRSHVQHRIPCLWYFQSAPLAKPETSCTIQISRERHALEKTKKTGGNSSVGRVPDCDSGCRGFESHFPPQNKSRTVSPCGIFFHFSRQYSISVPVTSPLLRSSIRSSSTLPTVKGRYMRPLAFFVRMSSATVTPVSRSDPLRMLSMRLTSCLTRPSMSTRRQDAAMERNSSSDMAFSTLTDMRLLNSS